MLCWKIGKSRLSLSTLIHYLFLVLSLQFFCFSVFAREIIDSSHVKIRLVEFPIRIVTLSPSLGELVADILGTDLSRIVGVTEFSDYPPTLKKKDSVGPYHHVNLEKIVSLRPDVVFATQDGNRRDQMDHLRELGIPVVVVSTENFGEILDSIRLVSASLGAEKVGEEMARRLKQGIERIRSRSKGHLPYRVCIQVGDDPLVVAGGSSFLQSALELVGARNVYADSRIRYPQPGLEDVLRRDPDVILVMAMGEELKSYRAMQKKWFQFGRLKAVRNQKVILVRSDPLIRPTLRILEGLETLSQILYGRIPS